VALGGGSATPDRPDRPRGWLSHPSSFFFFLIFFLKFYYF
jgi:hypothetical protein